MASRPTTGRRTSRPSDSEQDALLSPRRLDLVLALRAHGPGTAAELARWTGLRTTAAYAHLDELVRAAVVERREPDRDAGRPGAVFALRRKVTALHYDPDDGAAVERTCRYTRMVLRRAADETCRALSDGRPRVRGTRRQAGVGYARTWLSKDELARANTLLDELHELFTGTREIEGRQAFALTWALRPAPVPDDS